MKKKLKLTKLTVANLQHTKGGAPKCPCDAAIGNGAYNLNHNEMTKWLTICINCETHTVLCP